MTKNHSGVVTRSMVCGLSIGTISSSILAASRSPHLNFSFSASITFNIQIDGVSPTPAEPVLTKDIIADIKSWYDVAVEEKWQNFATRLKIRDACPIGKEKYRYEGDMLDYFFPISQPAVAVLERIKQKLAQKKRADEAETKSL